MRIFHPIHHLDLNINHFPRTLPCSKVSVGLVCIVSSLNSSVEFFDEIEIMRSLAKPRKITIMGSDGQIYMFLGKPKDDLRKDARLMDFNAMINKLLKANSESRRRQLRECAYGACGDTSKLSSQGIRTYGVITLNEECGFIQWVPNTIPIRPVLIASYDARRIRAWVGGFPIST
jgi:serine/threonine-protein kinase ATR